MVLNLSSLLLIVLFGVLSVLSGRYFCGKICPFGFFQDLLYKIPFKKKIRSFRADKYLRYLKYGLLIAMAGMFISGYSNTEINESQSFDTVKAIWWVAFSLVCIVISRPFCKYLCPLGLILGWFNRFSFGKFKVDQVSCTKCGVCLKACKMDIEPYKTPNHIECIRCGNCKKKCPTKAITSVSLKSNPSNKEL